MEVITIYNWGTIAMMISVLGFLAKIYNDFRKSVKAIRNEVRDLRTDVHESDKRMSGEIREVSDKVAELRGVLKGSRALPV